MPVTANLFRAGVCPVVGEAATGSLNKSGLAQKRKVCDDENSGTYWTGADGG